VWLTLNWLNLYAYGVLLLRTDGATTCDSNTARDARDALHGARCLALRASRGKRKKKKNIKKEK